MPPAPQPARRRTRASDGDASSSLGALTVERITTAEVTRRLSRRLRAMVGPGRRWSYRGVAQRTGIDQRSLKAYVAGTACPNLAKFKRLLAVLGPELAAEIDLMFGWKPRVEVALPPEAVDLEALRARLRDALEAIDRLPRRPPARPARRRDG